MIVATAQPRAGAPVRGALLAGGAGSARGAYGGYLGARVRRGRVSAVIEGELDAPASSEVDGGGVVRVQRMAGAIAPCAHVGAFAVCAALTVGRVTGRGEGFPGATSAAQPFAAAGPRLVWERSLTGNVSLQLRAEGLVALTSNQFLVDEMTVWRGARFDARLGLGISAQVP